MAMLDFNFNEVPDEIKPIPPGEYNLEVSEPPEISPAKSGKGNNMIVQFAVADGEFARRTMRHYFFLGNEIGLVNTKRFLKAAGITPGAEGISTEELAGRIVKAKIGERVYQDQDTGEDRTTSEIKAFMFE